MKQDPTIAIVDYGVGNLYNAERGFAQYTPNAITTQSADDIRNADAIVLPGVGSFESGMRGLRERNLIEPITKAAASGKPFFCICLGAQLILDEGHEFGAHKGLGLVKGTVTRFPDLGRGIKIPHIGWNQIYPASRNQWDNTIMGTIPEQSNMYFVHSYNLNPADKGDVLCLTTYGWYEFCSAVKHKNIYATQFHPERSGPAGLRIIEQFVRSI